METKISIRETILNIKNYFTEDSLKDGTLKFVEFSKIILNINVVNEFRKLLNLITKHINKPTFDVRMEKRIIISYAMVYFPDLVFDAGDNRKELITITKILHRKYENIHAHEASDESIRDFYNILLLYFEAFDEWSLGGSKNLAKEAAKTYWNLEFQITQNEELKQQLQESKQESKQELVDNDESKQPEPTPYTSDEINLIRERQQEIKTKLEKIGGTKALEEFDRYKPVVYDNTAIKNIFDSIENTFKSAYWDIMRQDIGDKNYNGVIKTYNEIRQLLCNLVPNREDIHELINETLDTEMLLDMLQEDEMDYEYLHQLCEFVIDKVSEFESESEDENTQKWKQELDTLFGKDNLEETIVLRDFFPVFLQKVFTKPEKIEIDTIIYKHVTNTK